MRHTITVVGIGPGDPAYLLPQARAAIHDARVLLSLIHISEPTRPY